MSYQDLIETWSKPKSFEGTDHFGLRLNNLSTAQRDLLTGFGAPKAGAAIWNTTTGALETYNGSSWESGDVTGLLAGNNIWTANGALSSGAGPAAKFNGTWITGGSATTTKPYFLIETTGATSTGWSTSGTGFGINAASGFTGNLFDAQLNGASIFKVSAAGLFTAGLTTFQLNVGATNRMDFNVTNANTWTFNAPGTDLQLVANRVALSGITIDGLTYLDRAAGNGVLRVLNSSAAAPGSLLAGAFVAAKTSAYPVVSLDSNKVFTNEGATANVVLTLPSAVTGYSYYAVCQDADGIQLTAASGDTIRIAASVSGTAGNIASTTIGSAVFLVAINATEWVAVSSTGTWVVT